MNMYWAYLHQNKTVQIKYWSGDHDDYTTDCEGNDFVLQVVRPFEATSYETARKIAEGVLLHPPV